jgi:hypothetical protein
MALEKRKLEQGPRLEELENERKYLDAEIDEALERRNLSKRKLENVQKNNNFLAERLFQCNEIICLLDYQFQIYRL